MLEITCVEMAHGLCQCGCGQKTRISKITRNDRGQRKGQPVAFVKGHNGRSTPAPALEDHGYETPCHVWRGEILSGGYGRIQMNGRRHLAHRYYYEQANGFIPSGLEIDHLCHVRACVNPDHMRVVTRAENARNRRDGKLTQEIVVEIRRAAQAGTPQKELARRYGVTPSAVSNVVNLKSWR